MAWVSISPQFYLVKETVLLEAIFWGHFWWYPESYSNNSIEWINKCRLLFCLIIVVSPVFVFFFPFVCSKCWTPKADQHCCKAVNCSCKPRRDCKGLNGQVAVCRDILGTDKHGSKLITNINNFITKILSLFLSPSLSYSVRKESRVVRGAPVEAP